MSVLSHMKSKTTRPFGSRHRLLTVVIVFGSIFAPRAFGLDSVKDLGQYVLRTWTTEQGLPQNSVRSMLQTRDGLLWLGTQGGLARFDGAGFVRYQPGAPNSIPGESITGLAEDRDGSLWISSNGGLSRYRNGRFQNYSSRDGLPDDSIWRIAQDPAGGVWAVTWRSQLFHFDGTTVRLYESPIPLRAREVNALLEDPHGTVWIATFVGLFAFQGEKHFRKITHKNGLAGDRVYALALDRYNHLWTAGDGGLSHQSADRFLSISIPELSTATLLAFDPGGQDDVVWTGCTGYGLFRVGPRGTERMRAAQGLISDELYLLSFSRDGSLWLGALEGLNQLSDGVVTSYSTSENLPKSTDRSQSPSHELWFGPGQTRLGIRGGALVTMDRGSNGGQLGHAEQKKQNPLDFMGPHSVWVRSRDRDTDGLIFNARLNRSPLTHNTLKRSLPPILWSSVDIVLIDDANTIWTGGSDIGVVAYSTIGSPRYFTTANGLDDDNVSVLAEDAAGDIWVGTLAGLDRIHHGVVSQVFSCTHVTSIEPSTNGSLWVSSESGLIYVPPALAPIRLFTRRDDLPTNLIQGVTEDTLGNLWLGTYQGIVRIKKADLLAPGSPKRFPAVFGAADGLRNTQLVTSMIFHSHDGYIWFMTLQELGVINPQVVQARQLAPILIDTVMIDDHDATIAPPASVTVPAGRHRMNIGYTLPEFQISSRLRFRYRLDGWDKNWTEAGSLREATYTGIPPGHYTFRVTNSNGYGAWNSGESTLTVKVRPYFYQTGWFLSLLALLAASFIWELHRMGLARVSAGINERLRERLQERTRIARELHDTLLQGVLGVAMQMYAASQQPHADSLAPSMLGHASTRLREIAEQSRKALEDLRSPSIFSDSFEAELARTLQSIELPAGVQFQIKSAGAPATLRPLVQTEVEQIAREAVANAVRHSGASSIRIDIVYQPAHFIMSVADNGCGIDPEMLEFGRRGHWGIEGMRERAGSIGGRLQILPHVPSGTVVEISLLSAAAYLDPPRGQQASLFRRLFRRRHS